MSDYIYTKTSGCYCHELPCKTTRFGVCVDREELAKLQQEKNYWCRMWKPYKERAEQAEALVKDLRDACSQRLEIINGQNERIKELESFIETAEYSELYDALQAIALLGKHGCIVADDCPVCIAKKALKGEK